MRGRKNFLREGGSGGLVVLWLSLASSLSALSAPPEKVVARADSLLRTGDYRPAAALYEAAARQQATPAVLLRLAFAWEQEGQIPDALWALRRTYERKPDRTILRKMEALAAANHLTGYEYGDRYFFLTLLRRYYQSALEFGLIGGVVLATVLVVRYRRHPQRPPAAGALLAYVALGALAANIVSPDRIGREVIVRRPAALMAGPSAGADWVTTLPPGQQLVVMGSGRDVWLPVRWKGAEAWLRMGDLYQ